MENPPPLHVCIATGQNLANLIPALQCQAHEVWILQTPEMRDNKSADHLADALRAHGIRIERIDFADETVEAIDHSAEDLALRLDAEERSVTINMSGGTKLMTLALVQRLASMLETGSDRPPPHIVYTDTRRQVLDWLRPVARSQPMQPILKLNDVLRVNGYERRVTSEDNEARFEKWLDTATDRKQLTDDIAQASNKSLSAISMINALASAALKPHDNGGAFVPRQTMDRLPHGQDARSVTSRKYLELLENGGLISVEHGTAIQFMSPEDARYCAGGWLEEYAALKADAAHDLHGEWRANLVAESTANQTRNEIDLLVVHDNRTLVVECKAGKFHDDDVNNWLSKLKDLCERVGGSQAKPLLLSVRELSEVQRSRAKDLGVLVCCGSDVPRFGALLHQWMANG